MNVRKCRLYTNRTNIERASRCNVIMFLGVITRSEYALREPKYVASEILYHSFVFVARRKKTSYSQRPPGD